MIQDARELPDRAEVECDVCVVGAGAAGIALGVELAGGDTDVVLLESGGLEPDEATQDLYRGDSGGTILTPESKYLHGGRLRYFGGTTNHWQGWCRPLDPIDFAVRSWIPGSGWPFDRTHLDPWYDRARAVVGLPPFDDDAILAASREPPLLPGDSPVATRFYYLRPVRFGVVHRRRLAAAANVRVLLHANAVDLVPDRDGGRIERLAAATLGGRRLTVRARRFVLATGGIENARLLLAADGERGIGNRHDLVGRYFCDHAHVEAGVALLLRPEEALALYDYEEDSRLGVVRVGILWLDEALQREHELLNCSLELRLADATVRPELLDEVGAATAALTGAAAPSGPADRGRAASDPAAPDRSLVTLMVRAGQTPNPESRVTLADERDALGQRRVKLRWRLLPGDRKRIRLAGQLVGRELGRSGVGRVRLADETDNPWRGAYGGHHHMGTTRMHPDPRHGVVDADCRVHGVANLFVAGSSVFPTPGFANPTLTLVALAIRLADHLAAGAGR